MSKAGYGEVTVRANVGDIFSSKGLQQALINLGVTPESLLTPANDAMLAKKGTFYQGEYIESESPDHAVRLKGSDQVAEILGIKKQIIEQRSVNVNVDAKDIQDMF